MKICQNCGHENREGSILCEKCGQVMEDFANTIIHTRMVPPAGPLAMRASGGVTQVADDQRVYLQVDTSPQAIVLPRTKQTIVVGRAQSADQVQPDLDLSPYQAYKLGVSRQHAYLSRDDDTITITDVGSANGTFVNGQRLTPHERRVLQDGDEVWFGQLVAHIYFK